MPIPQSIHIATEVALIGGMAAYFNKKIGKLQTIDDDIFSKIDKINQTIWHQRDIIEKLKEKIEKLESRSSHAPQTSYVEEAEDPDIDIQPYLSTSPSTELDCKGGYCTIVDIINDADEIPDLEELPNDDFLEDSPNDNLPGEVVDEDRFEVLSDVSHQDHVSLDDSQNLHESDNGTEKKSAEMNNLNHREVESKDMPESIDISDLNDNTIVFGKKPKKINVKGRKKSKKLK